MVFPRIFPPNPTVFQQWFRRLLMLFVASLLGIFTLAVSSIVVAAQDLQQSYRVTDTVNSINLSSLVSRFESDRSVSTPEAAYRLWQKGEFEQGLFDDLVHTETVGGSRWLAFRLDGENDGQQWILSTRDVMHLTRLTLYVPQYSDGVEDYRRQLDSLHAEGDLPPGTPISGFLIGSSFDSKRPFLIRVEGQLPLAAPLLLQTQQQAQREASIRIAITSLLIGAVLGLVLYNFILYFFVRDITYLLYVAYACTMLMWLSQISGYMIFLDRTWGLVYYHVMTPNMSAGVANFFGSLFTVVFLRLYQQNRWQGVLVMTVALSNVIVGGISYFLMASPNYQVIHKLQHVLAVASALVIVVPTILLTLKGYRFAFPFILAWGALGTGIILLGFGVQHTFWGVPFPTGFNVLAAMVVEMVMMSYALGLRIKDVQIEAEQLAQLSITDSLTGLFNQRYFHEKTRALVVDASVSGEGAWACAMVDIDHFKQFNDCYGHLLGDKVLKRLGQIIRSNVRQQDMAFRVGGEEFALLLKTDALAEALKVVDRIRCSFEESKITSESGDVLNCSLSAGVTLLKQQDSFECFVDRADQALYSAKSAGRNRVLVGA